MIWVEKMEAVELAKHDLLSAATRYAMFRVDALARGGRQMLDLLGDYERVLVDAAVAWNQACEEALKDRPQGKTTEP